MEADIMLDGSKIIIGGDIIKEIECETEERAERVAVMLVLKIMGIK